jgi:XTP/dITP diphosphohydrolase
MELIFATNNKHKVEEVQALLVPEYKIISLQQLHCTEDIPETAETLEGNALIKARYVYQRFGKSCFADDTGLEVEALNNAPGVYSARYAGDDKDMQANRTKLLREMEGVIHRNARFRTVVALIHKNSEYLFEGQVNGVITTIARGEGGFGYDPIFIADGMEMTFAELDLSIKNSISHRARAINKLVSFLHQLP